MDTVLDRSAPDQAQVCAASRADRPGAVPPALNRREFLRTAGGFLRFRRQNLRPDPGGAEPLKLATPPPK